MDSIDEMASIRAKEIYNDKYPADEPLTNDYLVKLIKNAYILGAKEQKEIDINKACSLYTDDLLCADAIMVNINPNAAGLIDIEESCKIFRNKLEKDGK